MLITPDLCSNSDLSFSHLYPKLDLYPHGLACVDLMWPGMTYSVMVSMKSPIFGSVGRKYESNDNFILRLQGCFT